MIFWKRRKDPLVRPLFGKVEIFSRHCLLSKISKNKKRPQGFSRKACLDNLLGTINRDEVNLTFFLDTAGLPFEEDHFLKDVDPLIKVEKGSEAGSFLSLLDHIASLQLHPDTLIYLVEDDYLHRAGWVSVLKEAFSISGVDYATLYDHSDKYDQRVYPGLESKIYATKSCHWRTTPSTTQTFAVRFSSLLEDLPIHRKFSQKRLISDDHKRFLKLGKKGRTLVSAIPGFSTHMDPEALSPCVDWTNQ